MGKSGLKKAAAMGGEGEGQAKAGLILGIIGTALSIIGIIIWIFAAVVFVSSAVLLGILFAVKHAYNVVLAFAV